MRVRAHVNLADVERGLDRAKSRSRALRSKFAELKKPLRADQRDHAKQRTGPDSPWAPRAASTLAHARQRGKRLRKPMGRLPAAVAYQAGTAGLVAESRAAWSGVHQEGGRVGRGSMIPARPFLWFSDRFLDQAAEVLVAPIADEIGGR